MPKTFIVITAVPIETRPSYFEARLGSRVLCRTTRQPFLDGCRALRQLGYPSGATVVMRSPGSATDRLRSTIGAAARLTVKETDRRRPQLAVWKPFCWSPVKPPSALRPVAGHNRAAVPVP